MYAAIFFNMEPNRKKDLPPTLLRVCIVGIEGDILLNMPIKRRKVNDQDDGVWQKLKVVREGYVYIRNANNTCVIRYSRSNLARKRERSCAGED